MNKETIIRVILAIGSVLNEAAVITGIAEFNNPMLNKGYQIVSFVFMVAVLFINTYFNNDFTPEGVVGTQLTRSLKKGDKIVNGIDVTELDAMGPGKDGEDDGEEDRQ